MQRTIPDTHRDRLVAAGYIRELVRNSHSINALALTGHGQSATREQAMADFKAQCRVDVLSRVQCDLRPG